MSAHGGPDIVTDGLVLDLDVGNPKSYPGTGTTCTSLVNATATSLVGGVSFDSANGGSLVFNGSSGYVDTSLDLGWNNTNSVSINIVCKTNVASQCAAIIGKGTDWEWCIRQGGNGIASNGLTFVYWNTGGAHSNGPVMTTTNFFTVGQWVDVCLTWNHTNNALNIYANGSKINTTTWTDASTNANKANTVKIGGYGYAWGGSNWWNGAVAHAQIYSAALTDAEVLQNFNANRKRFGF